MEILKRYMEDIAKDLIINEMNLKESAMRAPSKKHFWVGKLISHKIELLKLKKLKDKTVKSTMQEAEKNSIVGLSKVNLEKSIQNTDEVKKLTDQIAEHEVVVEYLEKTMKILSDLTWDVKNSLNATAMEQM